MKDFRCINMKSLLKFFKRSSNKIPNKLLFVKRESNQHLSLQLPLLFILFKGI